MKKLSLTVIIIALFTTMVFSQGLTQAGFVKPDPENKEAFYKHFLGSSLWVIYDKFTSDPADFYQLNYGYQFSAKDVLIVEAITWKYNEPLGTYGDSERKYPGEIRSYGLGLGYQRFHWKNLFTSVIATPFLNQFYDNEETKIQKGFQLYLQGVIGYRFEFFNKRLFIEPAYAIKYWPVNTNFPDSFAEIEEGASNHFFEPSLNFGIRF